MFRKKVEYYVEYFVFASRWIQAPIYIGLIIGTMLYCVKFIGELITMYAHVFFSSAGAAEGVVGVQPGSKEGLMLDILGLVDMSMVANLVYMVVVGGWTMFVSKIDMEGNEDRPDWLDSTNANTLKIKLAASLVGVSGIHLLKTFIELSEDFKIDTSHIKWQILIHLTFLGSSIALAFTEWMLHSSHEDGGKHKTHAPLTD